MATRFVIGRSGSGKSHFLHEELVRHVQTDPLHQSAFLLVPKHATFTAERKIATDPRLGGFINVRVHSPEDIAELAMVENGGASAARLDPVGRSLILGHLLRTHADQLPFFRNSAHTPGLAAEIDRAFGEFEAAGRDLCDINDIIEQAAGGTSDQQNTARKLSDLCALYKLYQDYLAHHQFDAYKRQSQAHEAIEKCPLVQKSIVLIDDFYEFTAYERRIICSLAKTARNTFIAMLLDHDAPILDNRHLLPIEASVFYRTEMTYRRLFFELLNCDVAVDSPIRMTKQWRIKPTSIKAIELLFETNNPKQVADDHTVVLQLANDPGDEVDSAARAIKELLAAGYRQRDICVLARSIGDYESAIDISFEEHGLSFFIDRRRSAQEHPLMRTLQALARLLQSRWSSGPILELARAGLIGVNPAEADLLEDYILQHNITRDAWLEDQPWRFHRPAGDEEAAAPSHFSEEDVDHINKVRIRFRQALSTVAQPEWLANTKPLRACVNDLFEVMRFFGVPNALSTIIDEAVAANLLQESAQLELGWTRFVELTDQMVDLLGDVQVTGQQFAGLLQTAVDELELAIIPPTLDQVLVGSVDRTRPQNPRAVILLGMNAGQFPRVIPEKAVLNDRDRQTLVSAGVEVEPPSRQMMLLESLYGYIAVSAAAEKLILIRTPRDAEGNELQPSPFWEMVQRRVSGLKPTPAAEGMARISTPRQAVSHALDWARSGAPPTSADAVIYDWLARAENDLIKKVRDRAWRSLSYWNVAALSKRVSLALFKSPLHASVSRIESFAACPYQHFARYGLRLQQPPDPDVSSLDLGVLYHTVLERVVLKTIEDHADFASTESITPEQIRAIAMRAGEELRNQVFLSNARNRYTLEHLERVVARLIEQQQFVASHGALRPRHAELTFGHDCVLAPLKLPIDQDKDVILSGKIDRLDIDPKSGRYSVIDYKLNGMAFDLGDVYHGLMLQLLTYLLVIDANGERLAGRELTPAAALYVKVLRSLESESDPQDAPDPATPAFYKKSRPRGVINADAISELDHSVAEARDSHAYSIKYTQKDELTKKGNDAIPAEQFQSLVGFVGQKITELAGMILEGTIAVEPYLIGNYTPCPSCSYLSVCRFDRLINQYRVLQPLKRDEALAMIEKRANGEEP